MCRGDTFSFYTYRRLVCFTANDYNSNMMETILHMGCMQEEFSREIRAQERNEVRVMTNEVFEEKDQNTPDYIAGLERTSEQAKIYVEKIFKAINSLEAKWVIVMVACYILIPMIITAFLGDPFEVWIEEGEKGPTILKEVEKSTRRCAFFHLSCELWTLET